MIFLKKTSETNESLTYIIYTNRYFLILTSSVICFFLPVFFYTLFIIVMVCLIDVLPLYFKMIFMIFRTDKMTITYEFEGRKNFFLGKAKMIIKKGG